MKDKFSPDKPAFFSKNPKVGENTNKFGFEAKRNKSRPYRNVRYVIDKQTGEQKAHPLDMMKMLVGDKEILVNTTGCFGSRNTFKEFGSVVIRTKAPGKQRAPRKRKNAGNLFYGDPGVAYQEGSLKRIIETRHKLLVAELGKSFGRINNVPQDWAKALDLIDCYLKARISLAEYAEVKSKDLNIVASMKGNNMPIVINVRKTNIDISRCLLIIRGKLRPENSDIDSGRERRMHSWKKTSKKITRFKKRICTSQTAKFR